LDQESEFASYLRDQNLLEQQKLEQDQSLEKLRVEQGQSLEKLKQDKALELKNSLDHQKNIYQEKKKKEVESWQKILETQKIDLALAQQENDEIFEKKKQEDASRLETEKMRYLTEFDAKKKTQETLLQKLRAAQEIELEKQRLAQDLADAEEQRKLDGILENMKSFARSKDRQLQLDNQLRSKSSDIGVARPRVPSLYCYGIEDSSLEE
jgi:hypothetical protein